MQSSNSLHSGSVSIPIIFAEIIPLFLIESGSFETNESKGDKNGGGEPPQVPPKHSFNLTNFGVKQFLLQETKNDQAREISKFALDNDDDTKRDGFSILWKDNFDQKQSQEKRKYGNIGVSSGYAFLRQTITDTESISKEDENKRCFPVLHIPSDNPAITKRQPCCVIAHAYRNQDARIASNPRNIQHCHFSSDTLIRILPPRLATNSNKVSKSSVQVLEVASSISTSTSFFRFRQETILSDLLGEEGTTTILSGDVMEEVLQSQNLETIDELTLKLSASTVRIQIGTTVDALRSHEYHESQSRKLQSSIQLFCGTKTACTLPKMSLLSNDNRKKKGLHGWPSLIVHSPSHADGKSVLVQAIAAKKLGCAAIHCVRPGALLAKYGTRADAALESHLHGILVSAACRHQKVCILIDPLDAILPGRLSGRSNAGDTGLPVFNSIASYLRKVTTLIQRKKEFPFPVKNPLYNSSNVCVGQVLTVEVCLVGVVTCPDDGWRSHQKNRGGSIDVGSTIFDCMISDRYRLPLLTTRTILSALSSAFEREGIQLLSAANERLAIIAGSSPWMRGSCFQRIAKELKSIVQESSTYLANSRNIGSIEATEQNLLEAIGKVNADLVGGTELFSVVSSSIGAKDDETKSTHFASIGGNVKAKTALEDALAFDSEKRQILTKFGLSPPTGVLLYGPPGCGKTLLAKAVANLLENPVSDGAATTLAGGTFLALSISEIVSAEIGTSEKTIVSCFEFAEKNAPSVIFLDEFQALFTDRNRGGSGKLTTTLLQCLDDVKMWYEIDAKVGNDKNQISGGKRVIVIAATNTPWMIDTAFLRPGRFDRVVHVDLPTVSERESILSVHIKRMRVCEKEFRNGIKVFCQDLSTRTSGFSGADIAALCRAAAIRALEEGEQTTVKEHHFNDALKYDVCQSSDDELLDRLSAWRP